MGAGLRPRTKVLDEPPDPNVGGPSSTLPSFEGRSESFPSATTLTGKESYSLVRRSYPIDLSGGPHARR